MFSADKSTTKFRLSHVPAIDGLRAFSIIFVLGYHGIGPVTASFSKDSGWIGVDAFFVVSGFLITSLLLKELNDSGRISFPNFWRRRFFRLFPAFIVYSIARLVLNPRCIDADHNLRAFWVSLFSLSDYDLALTWGNVNYTGFEPTWSLAVEEKFYLIWPFLLGFLGTRAPLFCVLGIVVSEIWKTYLVLQQVPWERMCPAFDTHLDSLLFGCLVAHLINYRSFRDWVGERGNKFVTALAFITLGLTALIYHPSSLTTFGRLVTWIVELPLFAACVAMLIACISVKQDLWVAKFLSLKPIQWVGVLSYSLYLWDGFYFMQVHQFCERNGLSPQIEEVLKYAVVFSFASASYYFVEKSFLRFRERYRFKSDTCETQTGGSCNSKARSFSLTR